MSRCGIRERSSRDRSNQAAAFRLGVALTLALSAPVAGQGLSIGVQGSSSEKADFGIGPRAIVDIGPLDFGFRLVGSFELFFPDDATFERSGLPVMAEDVDYWEANLNLVYTLGLPVVPLTPYFGGGLNFAGLTVAGSPDGMFDTDGTDTGVNVLAGIEFDAFSFVPFFEGRYTFGGGDQWVLTAGLMF